MTPWDRDLFRATNGWPDSLRTFLVPFSVGQDTLWFKTAILLIVGTMVWRGGLFRRAAILALVAFPVADWCCTFLKNAFPHPRPYQELFDVFNRVGLSESPGTASSHAANMAAVATVMTLSLGWRWGAAWIAVAFVVGLSRVYVGAHYPTQVVLGWLIGAFVGAVADGVARKFARPALVEQPSSA